MNLSHVEALSIFALLVSTVFALTTKNTPREQFRYGAFVFVTFLGVAFVVGWLMFPLPL
jgi:hypothetical protein